jgi:hypothetical protein
MSDIKVKSDRERLIAYASGIIGSTLSNPGNVYTAEQLMKPAIRAAHKLITTVYDDVALEAILKDTK